MTRRREERARSSRRNSATKRVRDRRAWLRFKYGITVEQWDRMLVEQSGRCWICLDPMANPFVDHDHLSGRVRGLLCSGCNTMLGLARDDVDLLMRASQYLER